MGAWALREGGQPGGQHGFPWRALRATHPRAWAGARGSAGATSPLQSTLARGYGFCALHIKFTRMQSLSARPCLLRAQRPFTGAKSRSIVRVRAEASTSSPVPIPTWPKDTESARDVFAFGGSAPEVSSV